MRAERLAIVSKLYRAASEGDYLPGRNDCFFLGLAVADAIGGTDFTARFSGAYRSLRGAHKALRRRGFDSVVDLMASLLPETGWALAQPGDVAVIDDAGAEHTAVHGGTIWLSITESGPRSWPLDAAKAVFRV